MALPIDTISTTSLRLSSLAHAVPDHVTLLVTDSHCIPDPPSDNGRALCVLAFMPCSAQGLAMISFDCPSCPMKFSVKPEFAGRTTRCPTCKHPLTVPDFDRTMAFDSPQQINGEESSLARIGYGGNVTLAPSHVQMPQRTASESSAERVTTTDRYTIEAEIARGGMGAVLRAVDADLRRAVAIKYMLDGKDPRKKARFVEEAQINAQLEHPNIVPVYDLRIDPQGRPFLMMKLVKGRDLKHVLDQLRKDAKHGEKEWSLGRLLNILVSVCNGLAFAHSHGVIHRDLKPANIMLGDFG